MSDSATSPQPEWGDEWDIVVDIVVVGSGAAAGSAAAVAAARGASVLVLEKSDFVGGTTGKSGGVMWVPNNPIMRDLAITDERDGALRYLARTGYPTQYQADHETLGLTPGTFRLLEAFYDHGCGVLDELTALGVWELEGVPYPDYYADLPEDLVGIGRVIQARYPDGWRRGTDPKGGQLLAEALLRTASEHGAEVRTGTEVVHLVRDEEGIVIGVEARVGLRTALYGARRGVIFGSGGFIHDREMARAHLRGPVLGGGAVDTATGDFVRIGIEAGAQLGNMSHAWWDQVVVEHAVSVPSTLRDVYSPFGDSMLMVNKYGKRAVNEKAVYNERGQAHFVWDPSRYEYPNLLLMWIFDHALLDDPRPDRFRWPVPMPDDDVIPSFMAKADTLDELCVDLRARVERLQPHTGGFALAEEFATQLAETVAEFNAMARAGRDTEFRRGESQIELTWAGASRPGCPNPTMAPLASTGPYYAVVLGAGALDTKGGPVTDEHGRVLGLDGSPIPGLYGAGNCVASPAGQAYWGPGGTIGPAVVFGALAARHASQDTATAQPLARRRQQGPGAS